MLVVMLFAMGYLVVDGVLSPNSDNHYEWNSSQLSTIMRIGPLEPHWVWRMVYSLRWWA
jgi:hypothetical protein